MRHFTEEEIEFVKKNLENEIPKDRLCKQIMKIDSRTFRRMCKEVGINYPTFLQEENTSKSFCRFVKSRCYVLAWMVSY